MSIESEVIEIVREMPGLSSSEITELMPHVKRQSIYATLNKHYTIGTFARTKGDKKSRIGRRAYLWSINEAGKPPIPVRSSAPDSDATLTLLRAEIADLKSWKAAAIERFPILAVDPVVAKARDIVAKELRAQGDALGAAAVAKGERDSALPMRLVVKMLEGEFA